ncbi:MAG: Nudix family hydrolase [Agitococcus sp.]|nr:Nudix family hydrolase [Agitococcus sp.]
MLNVVAAVIHNPQDQILIAQRPVHKHQGGLWEFAGGKIDDGETAAQALVRELQEELGIIATQYRPLLTVEHHYSDKSVRLQIFRVTAFDGKAHGAEGQPTLWVNLQDLKNYPFPAANTPIIKAAVLPDVYYITPEPHEVGGDLLVWLQVRVQAGMWLVLRAKSLSKSDYLTLAQQVAALCQQRQATLLLHGHIDLLDSVPTTIGVHLPFALASIETKIDTKNKYLVISTHNGEELEQAWQWGADFVTLSPVQQTLSHPEQAAMGWQNFATLVQQAKLPVYALGGMTQQDITQAQQLGAQGVAGIRGLFNGSR